MQTSWFNSKVHIAEPDSADAMQTKSGFHSRHASPQVSSNGKVKSPWIQRNKGGNEAQYTSLFPKHMLTHGLSKHTLYVFYTED